MSRNIFKISDLFNLSNSEIFNPDFYKPTSSFVIDSRKVKRGSIFIAIKGKNFDGHDFVKEAVKKGANAVVINKRNLNKFDDLDCTIITVKNTATAFGELAHFKREKLNYKVIAITGSNGKTTTKEFASTILSERFKTHKTTANNNNHIGVPLTISEAKLSDEVLVLELGTNHFGEIKYISEIANPNIALLTNIGSSHLKYLKDKKSILNEKSDLVKVAEKNNGKILINSDDTFLRQLKNKFKNVITFGFKNNPDIKGNVLEFTDEGYPKIEVKYKNRKLVFTLSFLGEAQIVNILNAVSIALIAGLRKDEILSGIEKLESVPGRFEVKELKSLTLIDDTYNSNTESIISGIRSIKRIKNRKKKIVILGDIFELGERAVEIHKELGGKINKLKPTEVITLGKMMAFTDELLKGNHKHFGNIRSLFYYLKNKDFSDSVILIKGSRGMKMERVVQFILEKEK